MPIQEAPQAVLQVNVQIGQLVQSSAEDIAVRFDGLTMSSATCQEGDDGLLLRVERDISKLESQTSENCADALGCGKLQLGNL